MFYFQRFIIQTIMSSVNERQVPCYRQICTCGKAVPFLETITAYMKEDPEHRTYETACQFFGCRRLCCRKTVLCSIDPAPRARLIAGVLRVKPTASSATASVPTLVSTSTNGTYSSSQGVGSSSSSSSATVSGSSYSSANGSLVSNSMGSEVIRQTSIRFRDMEIVGDGL